VSRSRNYLDPARDAVRDLSIWLTQLDWLTDAAWLLTLTCLGCAILDSYTSLCVVGGSLGHIGTARACPDFGGWDTRVFPIAVDAGWGGALFAVLRLARSIGLQSWRWWVVLAFEVVTAAFTVAGNAFHGAVSDGATAQMSGPVLVVISSAASAVPGVVAVGSGFTLSVLVSTRAPDTEMSSAPPLSVGMAQRRRQSATDPSTPSVSRRRTADGPRASKGRRPAAEVREMVRSARERLTAELGRAPDDAEVATRVTASGHPLSASRTRLYLAELRAESRRPVLAEGPGEGVGG
jgi:hypothetical protein